MSEDNANRASTPIDVDQLVLGTINAPQSARLGFTLFPFEIWLPLPIGQVGHRRNQPRTGART